MSLVSSLAPQACAGPSRGSRRKKLGNPPLEISTSKTDPQSSISRPSLNMNKDMAMPTRETTAASSIKSENSHEGGEGHKPNRKRKRKGLGNWTRTTLACNRCRKMKIRVTIAFAATDSSAMMLGLVPIVNDGHMNVSPRKRTRRKLRSSITYFRIGTNRQ